MGKGKENLGEEIPSLGTHKKACWPRTTAEHCALTRLWDAHHPNNRHQTDHIWKMTKIIKIDEVVNVLEIQSDS